MSETVLEAAPNQSEAGPSQPLVTETTPVVETKASETQQTPSEQTKATTTVVAEPAKDDAAKPPAEEKPKVEGAPEKYEFKAPDGQNYDPKVLTAFGEAAKAANLTQDAAQQLIESMAPALAARQLEEVAAVQKGWLEASSSDKEFGGEKLKQNLGIARKALDTFGTPELKTLLDETGFGNHPEVLRMLYRAGNAISEDTVVTGNPSDKTESGARSFYPNSNMK